MNGLSSTTSKKLYDEYGNYNPSAAVTEAQKKAQDYEANNNPTGNARSQQASSLLDAYLNRGSYNANVYNTDLYKRFEANALKNGKIAANNAAAEAAALSGGYGNSYGVSAAAAANQRYVDSINDYALQLDQMNYDRWKDEGDLAYNKYAAAKGDYQQMLEDYYTNRDYYANRAQQAYANDYGQFSDARSYWQNLGAQENSDYWNTANFNENQRQYNASLAENQRQFNSELALDQYKAATGGSSSKSPSSSGKATAPASLKTDALNKLLSVGGNTDILYNWMDQYRGEYSDEAIRDVLDYVESTVNKARENGTLKYAYQQGPFAVYKIVG